MNMNSTTPENWPEDLRQWASSGTGLPALHQIMMGTMMADLAQARHVGALVEVQQAKRDALKDQAEQLERLVAAQKSIAEAIGDLTECLRDRYERTADESAAPAAPAGRSRRHKA